jgi:hypothetical protein
MEHFINIFNIFHKNVNVTAFFKEKINIFSLFLPPQIGRGGGGAARRACAGAGGGGGGRSREGSMRGVRLGFRCRSNGCG